MTGKNIKIDLADLGGGGFEGHVDLFWTFTIPKNRNSNTLNLNYTKTINVIVLIFLGVLDLSLMCPNSFQIVIICKTLEMVKNRGIIKQNNTK